MEIRLCRIGRGERTVGGAGRAAVGLLGAAPRRPNGRLVEDHRGHAARGVASGAAVVPVLGRDSAAVALTVWLTPFSAMPCSPQWHRHTMAGPRVVLCSPSIRFA